MGPELNDEVLVRYLLGELTEPESDRIECAYFSDEGLHEQILAMESELTDAYLHGQLAPDDLRRFESRFMSTREGRDRVDAARATQIFFSLHRADTTAGRLNSKPVVALAATLGTDEKLTWWRSVARVFSFRSLAGGPAFAVAGLLVLAAVGFLRTQTAPRSKSINTESAGTASRTTNGDGIGARNSNANNAPNAKAGSKSSDPAVGKRPLILAFALASLTRSDGRGNTIDLPAGQFLVRLSIMIEPGNYTSYAALVETAEGKQVFAQNPLAVIPDSSAATGNQSAAVTIASRKLIPGDYILQLTGTNPDGTVETVGGYSFHVVRSSTPGSR